MIYPSLQSFHQRYTRARKRQKLRTTTSRAGLTPWTRAFRRFSALLCNKLHTEDFSPLMTSSHPTAPKSFHVVHLSQAHPAVPVIVVSNLGSTAVQLFLRGKCWRRYGSTFSCFFNVTTRFVIYVNGEGTRPFLIFLFGSFFIRRRRFREVFPYKGVRIELAGTILVLRSSLLTFAL